MRYLAVCGLLACGLLQGGCTPKDTTAGVTTQPSSGTINNGSGGTAKAGAAGPKGPQVPPPPGFNPK